MKIQRGDGEMGSEEKKYVCEVCCKEFGSIKAVHGHMRSHPDRTWRGIRSPVCISSSSSPSSSISSLSWCLTARRGCKDVRSAAAISSSSSEAEPNLKANSTLHSDDHQLFPNALMDELAQQEENNLSSPPVKKMKKRKELELKRDDEANLKQKKKLYKCNRCGKEFCSHEALGGHRSSHYKAKTLSLQSDLIRTPEERRGFNFDLNELPPMEENDHENGEAKQVMK